MSIPALTPGLSSLKRVFIGTKKKNNNTNTTNKKSNPKAPMQSKDKYHDDHDINDFEHSNDDIDMDDEFFQENEHFNDADFESILGTETDDHLINITTSTIQDKPPLLTCLNFTYFQYG